MPDAVNSSTLPATPSAETDSWRRVVLENALDAVVGVDQNSRVIDWNRQAEVTFGWSKEEVLGKDMAELIIPSEFRDAHHQGMARFVKTGAAVISNRRIELEALHRNGSTFPVELTVVPVPAQGKYLFYSFIRDISEKRRNELKLQQSEENSRKNEAQLKLITNALPAYVSYVDRNLRYRFVNQAYENWFGKKAEEIIGKLLKEVMGDENYRTVEPNIQKALNGYPVEYEYTLRNSAGELRYVIVNYIPQRDENGNVLGFIVLGNDITGRRKAEVALQDEEARFRMVAEAIPQLVWTSRADGKLTYGNPKWEEFTGFSIQKLSDIGFNGIFHPSEIEANRKLWTDAFRTGEPFSLEYRIRRKDGAFRWFLGRGLPLRDPSGKITQWFGTATEIDDQKRAQEALGFLNEVSVLLAESLDYRTTLTSVAKLAISKLADWCSIDILNDAGKLESLAVTHKDPSKVEFAKKLRAQYPAGVHDTQGAPHVVRTGKPELYSRISDEFLQKIAKDESHLDMLRHLGMQSAIVVPLINQGTSFGTLTLVAAETIRHYDESDLALAQELAHRAALAIENSRLYSDLKKKEQALQEAVRARDEFLSIASHELKTPLTTLKLQTQMVRRNAEFKGEEEAYTPDRIRRVIHQTERQVERLTRLVDDMLDIARIATGKLTLFEEWFDLSKVVEEAVERVAPMLDQAGCTIQLNTSPNIFGRWDRFRIEQVVVNLLSNAAKYGAGKPVEIAVRNTGTGAEISIQDSGMGIAIEDQERIFQRFERAVSSNEISGLGLGLFIVYQIIAMHKGSIRVESAETQGARFIVTLPL